MENDHSQVHQLFLRVIFNSYATNHQGKSMERGWNLALNLWLHWLHCLHWLHLDGLSGHGMDIRLPLRLRLRLAILYRSSVVVGMHGAQNSKVKVIFTSPYGSRRKTWSNEWGWIDGWTCIRKSQRCWRVRGLGSDPWPNFRPGKSIT